MRRWILFVIPLLLMGLALGAAHFGPDNRADAAPIVRGNPDGATLRAIVDSDAYKEIVYVSSGAKTMLNTTPVNGSTICNIGDAELFTAHAQLVGTMAGTNPTLSIQMEQSFDHGTTWVNVGSAMTVNATVTPADQSQTWGDVYNNTTAVAFANCFRAQYTWGGTGTVTANFQVVGSAQ